jgi:large subunit ribosomal protein L18
VITRDRRSPRDKRHYRLRRHLRGSSARPRLAVFRSLGHIYAQLVDDDAGRTVLAVDSRSKTFLAQHKTGGNVAAAKAIGTLLAEKAKAAGIQSVVFDRGGYQYHGRVKALADAARAGGLTF